MPAHRSASTARIGPACLAVKRGGRMAVRVIVSIDALPGKGPELARLRSPFQADVRKEPGCEQFDLFQNTENPDKLLLVERWSDQTSLDAHAERNRQRPSVGAELRAGPGRSEHYAAD